MEVLKDEIKKKAFVPAEKDKVYRERKLLWHENIQRSFF
jgi:hypothetical protein